MMAAAKMAAATRKQMLVETTFLEGREILELFETGIDLLAGQCAEPIDAEAFAAEAAHHRAVDHGAAQLVRIHVLALDVDSRARQIAHETTRETIAGARRIEHIV